MASTKEEGIKDRLLDNCGESIKQLQIEFCHSPERIFTGEMWQVQEFCSRLDSTLNHGLKRISDGYWLFVRDLSHKSVIKSIESLPNVQSNSDKCYAWLQLAINEHALESYLRAVMDHPKSAKSIYTTHALIRDSQRLHLLVMLIHGLEHLPFNLNWNDTLKYRKSISEPTISELSCDSDVEEAVNFIFDSNKFPEDLEKQESDDDPEKETIKIVTFDPISGIPIKIVEENGIVHSSTRVTRKRKKMKSINNNVSTLIGLNKESELPNEKLDNEKPCDENKKQVGTIDRERFLESILNNEINLTLQGDLNSISIDEKSAKPSLFEEETSVYDNAVKAKDSERVTILPKNRENESSVINEGKSDSISQKTILDLSERGVPEGQEDPMITSSSSSASKKLTALFEKCTLDDSWLQVSPMSKVNKSVAETNSAQLRTEIDNEVVEGKEKKRRQHKAGEVILTNNFLLMIMLEVVVDQEEKVYRVFRALTGHTVGSAIEIFCVLTDQRLYIIHWNADRNHFQVDTAVNHSEIEFIQFGLNSQFLNIVCASPRRRYWISTGDEESSRNIVSSLEVTIRRNLSTLTSSLPPSVYTQATMQTIAIRKWVANTIGLDNFEKVEVHHYAFIRWEDPHAAHFNSDNPAGPSKEGFLMYLYTSSKVVFGNTNQWNAAYFRLKAGIFYHFNDPMDTAFRNYIQLVNGECVGCRHLQNSSRPYTFEILLSGDRSLYLAASSEEDASLWLQVILQSVSQGHLNGAEIQNPCICGCIVISSDYLLICQEQLETNTFSLLAKSQLQDIAAINVDPSPGATYCIVEFETADAMESSGDWVIHLASENELNKFLTVVKSIWSALYKVPLAISHVLDPNLQKRFYSSKSFYSFNSSPPFIYG